MYASIILCAVLKNTSIYGLKITKIKHILFLKRQNLKCCLNIFLKFVDINVINYMTTEFKPFAKSGSLTPYYLIFFFHLK